MTATAFAEPDDSDHVHDDDWWASALAFCEDSLDDNKKDGLPSNIARGAE